MDLTTARGHLIRLTCSGRQGVARATPTTTADAGCLRPGEVRTGSARMFCVFVSASDVHSLVRGGHFS